VVFIDMVLSATRVFYYRLLPCCELIQFISGLIRSLNLKILLCIF